MKSLKLILILFIVFLYSCKDEITGPREEGASKIAVTVVDSADVPLINAEVIISSPKIKKRTDAYGIALFENVPAGTREVIGYVRGSGSGKSFVEVKEGILNKDTIKVISGRFYEPEIKIISPERDQKFTPGQDTVRFNIEIRDNETPEESIRVEFLAGAEVLAALYPDKNGFVSFGTNSLSEGEHTVIIKAYEDDEIYGLDSVKIKNVLPYSATMNAPVHERDVVNLSWSDISGLGASKIELIRTHTIIAAGYSDTTHHIGDTVLFETDDLSKTSYTDTIDAFYLDVSYRIASYNERGEKKLSNAVKVEYPAGKLYHLTNISATGFDQVNNLLYIAENGGNVIVYSAEEEKEKFVKTFPSTIQQLLCGDNGFGNELYAVDDKGIIRILDPVSLEEITRINVNKQIISIEIDGDGHIFATVKAGIDDSGMESISRSDGALIDANSFWSWGDNIIARKAPGSAVLIGINYYDDLLYIEINSDGAFGEIFENWSHSYNISQQIFEMSPTEDLMITSSAGSIFACGSKELPYKGRLSSGGNKFRDFSFSPDGQTIYGSLTEEKFIEKYNVADVSFEERIKLKGYSKKVYHAGDKLISISSLYYGQSHKESFGIEAIPLL